MHVPGMRRDAARIQQHRQPGDRVLLIERLHRPAPPRSDDNGSTAISSGANAFDSTASDGISATHGTHHVAQRLITMPWPRKSAR